MKTERKPKQFVTPDEFAEKIQMLERNGIFLKSAMSIAEGDTHHASVLMNQGRAFLQAIKKVSDHFIAELPGEDFLNTLGKGPFEAAVKQSWEALSPYWITTESPMTYFATFTTLIQRMSSPHGTVPPRCLSLGSGPGMYEIYLANLFRNKINFITSDYSEEMINQSKKYAEYLGCTHLEHKVFDMKDIPFSSKSLDMVIVNNSLQWSFNQEDAIKEVSRVLKYDCSAYFVIHMHNMVFMHQDDGEDMRHMRHIESVPILDVLEENKLRIQFTRVMASSHGQAGGVSNRMFVEVRKERGKFPSWRERLSPANASFI